MIKKLILAAIFFNTSTLMAFDQKQLQNESREQVLTTFQNPPAEYRSKPFWVWNNRITEQQIDEQLSDFKEKGIGGVFVHPRPGLVTPYLSDEWFSRFGYAVKAGKKLGMQVWIYDENTYPAGYAGGNVPAEMPESVGKALKLYKTSQPDTFKLKPFAFFKLTNGKLEKVTSQSVYPKGNYYVYFIQESGKSDWSAGYFNVDLLQKKVTNKVLEITFDKGYNKFSKEYGKTIPGTFSDEPNIMPVWGDYRINYSDTLFAAFKSQNGYSLADSLPMLSDNIGTFLKVRHDFYSTLNSLFINSWAVPYQNYCHKHNLIHTGHYFEHGWPIPNQVPDNMAMYSHMDMPGIDLLLNQWSQGYNSHFGNTRIVKELRSVANQLGQSRTLSETYGAAGWDISFQDQKRIADWECALGVNFLVQHLSFVSIAGARKCDHPQSFSYHEPWWSQYKVMADYIGRLSVAMAKGEQVNKILVIEPTTTAWMNYSPNWRPNREVDDWWMKGKLGNMILKFHAFINQLENWNVEYDLGSEYVIKNHGSVENNKLVVGKRAYSLIVLPESLENIDSSTLFLLEKYMANSGKVLSYCGIPAYVEGNVSSRLQKLADKYRNQFVISSKPSKKDIFGMVKPEICFTDANPTNFVFHHRRQLDNGQLIFIANIHKDSVATGKFTIAGGSLEQWDLFTGQVKPYQYSSKNGIINASFNLNVGESLLLCVKKEKYEQNPDMVPSATSEIPLSRFTVKRLDPNVLTLDYCSIKLNNKLLGSMYFYEAQKLAYNAFGFYKNPWDNAVQFNSQILDRDALSANTGFEATYSFNIAAGTGLNGLKAVVERPEYFNVSVNGSHIAPDSGKWWLDKDFAVYNISKFAKEGLNQLTVTVKPMRVLAELESVYILGNFGLKSEKVGYSIVPEIPMESGSWKNVGMPMFSGKVSYSATITAKPSDGRSYNLKIGNWKGVVAELFVNSHPAGTVIN